VLAADLLQSIVNKARSLGLINVPIPVLYTDDFPILQYADDTQIIMEGCGRQLFVLKALLNTFAASTGLRVNFNKSMLVPINLTDEKTQHMAATFGCSIGAFYLPRGTHVYHQAKSR
jgi:hypothetical protein